MDCQEALQVILGAGDVDAELVENPTVAAHVAGCADCQKLVQQVKTIDTAAKAIPLPVGYARVPEAFLRRIDQEAATPRRKGCFAQFVRRAIAAGLIITIGVMAVALFMFNGSQARADVVLGQLVQWNLDIEKASPAERAKIYQSHAAVMQAQASKLTADDGSLAKVLLDNAQWLTTESDPAAETKAFTNIAAQINSRAAATSDPAASAHLKEVYLQVMRDGIHANPTMLPQIHQQFHNTPTRIDQTPTQTTVTQTRTQPDGILRRLAASNRTSQISGYIFAGGSPRILKSAGANIPSSSSSSNITTSHSWSSTGTFTAKSGTESYAASGSSGGNSHASDSRTGNSHASSTSTHTDPDSDNTNSPTKCDPTSGLTDDTSSKRTNSRSPFDELNNLPTTKLANLPNSSNYSSGSGYKGTTTYDNGSSKSSASKPTVKQPTGSTTSDMPVISSPSADQTAGATSPICSLPSDTSDDSNQKSDDKSDADSNDIPWQKPDDYSPDKTWDKPDDATMSYHGKHHDFDKNDDGSFSLQKEFTPSDDQMMSSSASLLPAIDASPEPTSAAMLMIGGFLLIRRRRSVMR